MFFGDGGTADRAAEMEDKPFSLTPALHSLSQWEHWEPTMGTFLIVFCGSATLLHSNGMHRQGYCMLLTLYRLWPVSSGSSAQCDRRCDRLTTAYKCERTYEDGRVCVMCSRCTAVLVFVTRNACSGKIAALSCRVVVRAGSSCQGGSSDAGASSGQIHLLLLLFTNFVSFIHPQPSVPSVPLVLGFAPGVDGGASERWGLLLPPGGAVVPVPCDLPVWPQVAAQDAPAGEEGRDQ